MHGGTPPVRSGPSVRRRISPTLIGLGRTRQGKSPSPAPPGFEIAFATQQMHDLDDMCPVDAVRIRDFINAGESGRAHGSELQGAQSR